MLPDNDCISFKWNILEYRISLTGIYFYDPGNKIKILRKN